VCDLAADAERVMPRGWRFVIMMFALFAAVAVGVVRNWKIAEHPPCVSLLDRGSLAGWRRSRSPIRR
jgi:hypothetical protein